MIQLCASSLQALGPTGQLGAEGTGCEEPDMKSRTTIPDQPYTCPEAMYWRVGDLILIGKGENSHYFRCVKRLSPVTVVIRYLRRGARRGDGCRITTSCDRTWG